MTFELLLADGKIKPQQITALHLMAAFAILGTGSVFYFFYSPMKTWGTVLLAAGFLLMAVSIFRNKWIMRPEVNRMLRVFELMASLCLAAYMALNQIWVPVGMFGILSAVILLAFIWERGSGEQSIYISEEGIKLPFSSRKRFIEWRDVDNVLYKFGTLTIECDGNRLYQWSIKKSRFDNYEFEKFCGKQIEAHKTKRVAEW
jgi:hypothetical protein